MLKLFCFVLNLVAILHRQILAQNSRQILIKSAITIQTASGPLWPRFSTCYGIISALGEMQEDTRFADYLDNDR